MMKKSLSLIAVVLLSLQVISAQQEAPQTSRYSSFRQLMDVDTPLDTLSIGNLLANWEAEAPQDIELQSAKFQYLIRKALLDIEMPQSPIAENTAMLPDIPGLYDNLQFTNYWILQDKGNAMKNYQQAYEIIDHAIGEHPERLDLYYWKADGYMQKFEHRRGMLVALDVLQQSRKSDWQWYVTNNRPATIDDKEQLLTTCVSNLLEHSEFSLAQIMVDSMLCDNPKSIAYRGAQAIVYECMMKPDSAIQIYQQLNVEAPDNYQVALRIAACYLNKGDKEQARPYLEQIAANPDEEVAAYGRQLLMQIQDVVWKYDEVEQWMKEHAEEFKNLQQRFIEGDETLTPTDIGYIYFGQAFTDSYSYINLDFGKAKELLNNAEYEQCLALCKTSLQKTPASLTMLMNGAMACQMLQDNETLVNFGLRINQLATMLGAIGQVTDIENPIPVLWVEEEYTILRNVGNIKSQSLLHIDGRDIDNLKVEIEQPQIPLPPKDGEVVMPETQTAECDYYFDVSYGFRALQKAAKQ